MTIERFDIERLNPMALLRNIPGSSPTPVTVRVLASPVIEAMVAFWAVAAGRDEAFDLEDYAEVARIRDLVAAVDAGDDTTWLDTDRGHLWLTLLPLVDRAAATTFEALADHVEELGAVPVHALLQQANLDDIAPHDGESGTVVAEGLSGLLEDPAEVHGRLLRTLRALDERVGPQIAVLEPMLNHGAELETFLARRMPLDQLVETVTNGVAYQPEAGIREVVLVPSVMLRPWNLLLLHGESRYVLHPISEESLGADGDTPPRWMIDLFKALGDERRLRVLRRLRDGGGATLGELTEYLDLAKSTTHHHLRILRAAGLVRTRITGGAGKDEQVFELRKELFEEAVANIGGYLLGTDPGTDEET